MLKIKEYLLSKELWCFVAALPVLLFNEQSLEAKALFLVCYFILYLTPVNWLLAALTGSLTTMPLLLSNLITPAEAGFYFGAIFAATNLTLRLFFSEFLERF